MVGFFSFFPAWQVLDMVSGMNTGGEHAWNYYEMRETWMYFAVICYLQKERASACPYLSEECILRKRLLNGVEEMRTYFYSEDSILEGISDEMYEEIHQTFGEESNWCPEFDEDTAPYAELLKPYYLFKFMEKNERYMELLNAVSLESKMYLAFDAPAPKDIHVYEVAPDSKLQLFYEACKRTKDVTRLLTGEMRAVFEECHKMGERNDNNYHYSIVFGDNDMQDMYEELSNLVKSFHASVSENKRNYMLPPIMKLVQMDDYYIVKMTAKNIAGLFSNYLEGYLKSRCKLEYDYLPKFSGLLTQKQSGGVPTSPALPAHQAISTAFSLFRRLHGQFLFTIYSNPFTIAITSSPSFSDFASASSRELPFTPK